jgi:hypothetical protein
MSFNNQQIGKTEVTNKRGGSSMFCIYSAAKEKFKEDYQKQQQAAKVNAKTNSTAIKK